MIDNRKRLERIYGIKRVVQTSTLPSLFVNHVDGTLGTGCRFLNREFL